MANEIKIDLKLTGEQATARGLDNVGDKAKGAGDDLDKMAKDAGFLDKRIGELRKSTKELSAEFARTGDKDIFKQLKGASRELGQLDALKKKFFTPDPGPDSKGFLKGLTNLGSEMGDALGAAKGPAIAGGVALGAAISPVIGSAIAAGVLGGVGAGGIAGGIALAARDSRVKAEAETLGATVSQGLTTAGEPFVAPLIESIRMVDKEFGGWAEGLRESLGTIAPVLKPLTEGIDGLVDRSMPGLIKGLEAAKPVLRVVAKELPDVGDALGDFFEDISEDGDGAVMAMKGLFQITTGVIRGTGELVGWLERAYESSQRFGVGAAEKIGDLAEKLQYIAPVWSLVARVAHQAEENYRGQVDAIGSANDASDDFRNTTETLTTSQYLLGGTLTDVNDGLDAQRKAMENLFGVTLGLRDSTRDIEAAIDSFSDAVDENGTTLDISTEAGRRNQEAIDNGAKALERGSQAAYEAARATGATVLEAEEAAKRYRAQWIPALEAAAIKAGFNRDQVLALLEALKKLDGKVVSYSLIQKGGKTIGAKYDGGTVFAGTDYDGRASGGPVYPGQAYVVGENGPEVLQMGGSASGHVFNASQTTAMMSAAPAAPMTAPPQVNINLTVASTGRFLEDAIMELVAKQLRIQGGVVGEFRIPSHEAYSRPWQGNR